MFEANGISLKPSSPAKDQELEIFYKGLLVNSGADGVYLHYTKRASIQEPVKPWFAPGTRASTARSS